MAAVSKVLEDDDLLTKILLHTILPTTLVNSVIVCTRWLTHASDRAFLCRFREIHPPHLLGFYINKGQNTPQFIPILPQPLDLASVIRRATSRLGIYQKVSPVPTYILGCRNGNNLIRQHDKIGTTFAVHKVVCPERGMDILPPFPLPQFQYLFDTTYSRIMSKREGNNLSYLYVLMHQTRDRKHRVYIYILRHGIWCMNHILTIDQPPRPWSVLKCVLSDNKIYVPAGWSNIVVLDLAASSLSVIELLEGMEYGERNHIVTG
uniref:F-box protein AT5G49610-like beta-propeller domain-containing protein n=1 Tax=Hordeum vulgare subsp. vulgare TaxID=112509 RepID=A0A8I6Y117_HORVV